MHNLNVGNKRSFIKVNFTNRGLARVISRVEDPGLADIAELFSDVKIVKGEPILFKTLQEFLGIDYVGYIIEKERLDKTTGEWIRTDEYKIIGSEANSFVDTRVAYGQTYRYRMKSVVKLSKSKTTPGLSHLEVLEDLKKLESRKIERELRRNKKLLEELDSFTNARSHHKLSRGREEEEHNIELSDNVRLRATNNFTDLVKDVQYAPDRWGYRPRENLKVQDIRLVRSGISDVELQRIINQNLARFSEQKVEYFSCYFESDPNKNWTYVDVVENIPPPPPQTIKIVPSTPNNQIMISWLKPSNDQRDIKYFKVYRRNGIGQPWRLLSQFREVDVNADGTVDPVLEREALIGGSTNLFIDRNVRVGAKYIYALSCVDVHNIESFLSTQIQAELNSNFQVEKEEKPLRWISGQGARLDEVDFVFKKFLNRTEQIIAKRNIILTPNTKFNDVSKNLIVRITSLDTHERKEIKVVLKNVNIKEAQI